MEPMSSPSLGHVALVVLLAIMLYFVNDWYELGLLRALVLTQGEWKKVQGFALRTYLHLQREKEVEFWEPPDTEGGQVRITPKGLKRVESQGRRLMRLFNFTSFPTKE